MGLNNAPSGTRQWANARQYKDVKLQNLGKTAEFRHHAVWDSVDNKELVTVLRLPSCHPYVEVLSCGTGEDFVYLIHAATSFFAHLPGHDRESILIH